MKIHLIQEKDYPKVRNLRTYAFRDWDNTAPTEEELQYYSCNDFIGLFDDKENLLSIIRNYNFIQSVRGVLKKMGGVATVATAPEHRNKGYVKTLFNAAFKIMLDKNQSVSMLQPFSQGFYERFEYIAATVHMEITVPLQVVELLHDDPDEENSWTEQRDEALSLKSDFQLFKYDVVSRTHNGLVLGIPDPAWKERNKNEMIVIIRYRGEIRACAKYAKKGFASSGELLISEMFWQDIASRRRLFSFFAKHRDQIQSLRLPVPEQENFYHWFNNSMSRDYSATIGSVPWMLRVVNLSEALSSLRVPCDGFLNISVDDKHCPWNRGLFELRAQEGILSVHRSEAKDSIAMDIRAVTALLYGVMDIEEILAQKWLTAIADKDKELLQQWFPRTAFFSPFLY